MPQSRRVDIDRHNRRVTPEQAAALSRGSIDQLGSAFAEDPATLRRARQLGLTGWAFYLVGRAGVLGDVDPVVVQAAIGLVAGEAVRDGWTTASRVAQPAEVARYHREECRRWGRERLEVFDGVAKLTDLAGRVVQAAEAAGMPLFAAWRAVSAPLGEPGADAAALLHLLREHWAGAYLLAIRAAGLTPLEAILTGPEGEAGALAAGWQPPYPQPGLSLRRLIRAQALTDRIVGQALAVLSVPERTELVELLAGAQAFTAEPMPR
jgi:hypothetical protein